MTSTDNLEHNLALVTESVTEASNQGVALVVLPEMFINIGINSNIWLQHTELLGNGKIQDFLGNLARDRQIWIVAGTIPIRNEYSVKPHASCLIFNHLGCCVGCYHKQHLFDVAVTPGQEIYKESDNIEPGSQTLVIDSPLGKLGLAICYDLRFPQLFIDLAAKGCEIIAIPAAFTVPTGRAHWETLIRARALDTFSYVIAAGQTGIHPNNRQTYGHSMLVGPWGNIIHSLDDKPGLVIGEIDHSITRDIRKRFLFSPTS